MPINEVIVNGTTLISLRSDTATAADVAQGKTFHDASGALMTGTAADVGNFAEDLAAALQTMGVTASASEGLDTLIEKVLMIRQGDLIHEYFTGTVVQPSPSYGFWLPNEVLPMEEIVEVEVFNLMGSMTVTITPPDPSDITNLSVSGAGWTVTTDSATGVVTAVYTFSATAAKYDVLQALRALQIAAADGVVTISCHCTGYNSGDTFACAGTATISWQKTSWAALEALYPKWSNTEGKTWSELENAGKPAG